ncbi:GH3 auxin-responsive promoter family protein [Candidatus Bathyarchaeota archaeon]|nr:GH3 auxin-responsive promoter family protein [Candidatus Bathyarchaeota archaeon]
MLEEALRRVERNLGDWRRGLKDPAQAQEEIRLSLLGDYSKTEYGQQYTEFPAVKYVDLKPWLRRVEDGDYGALLAEEPITWVMTRGTTGESKVIPVTKRNMDHLVKGGSRAVLNHALNTGGLASLAGGVLNLQFPSNMRTISTGSGELSIGFSSGTYARLNPMMAGLGLIPRQEEIDALETGIDEEGWEKRYEYIYQRAREEDVVTVMGVAPVQTGFARYLKKRHGVYPRDLWSLKVIFSTSVAKIQGRYTPWLRRMYGDAPVVEMYTATEGAFGQQMDGLPYWVPNYDLYYYEVRTGGGVKMLHELRRGEWGRLIVSTPLFPRYEIGDLVEAMGKNYFRVFGRDKPRIVAEHLLYRAVFGWLL